MPSDDRLGFHDQQGQISSHPTRAVARPRRFGQQASLSAVWERNDAGPSVVAEVKVFEWQLGRGLEH
jgi:hypothetical protein